MGTITGIPDASVTTSGTEACFRARVAPGAGSQAEQSSRTPCARRKALQLAHVRGEEQGQVFVERRRGERLEALSS